MVVSLTVWRASLRNKQGADTAWMLRSFSNRARHARRVRASPTPRVRSQRLPDEIAAHEPSVPRKRDDYFETRSDSPQPSSGGDGGLNAAYETVRRSVLKFGP